MQTMEAPDLDGFRAIDTFSVMGVDYLHMRNPDGIGLKLTQEGIDRIDSDPKFAALLQRAASFVTEHGLYGDFKEVMESEPSRILAYANDTPDPQRFRPSSVYVPKAASDTIVKTYEYDPEGANLQFNVMSWLHKHTQLRRAGDIKAPRQYALLRARSGEKTAFMEYLDGTALTRVPNILSADGLTLGQTSKLMLSMHEDVKARLQQSVGDGRHIFNDLHSDNILLFSRREDITADNLLELPVGIIDQPATRMIVRGIGFAMNSYEQLRETLPQNIRRIKVLRNVVRRLVV